MPGVPRSEWSPIEGMGGAILPCVCERERGYSFGGTCVCGSAGGYGGQLGPNGKVGLLSPIQSKTHSWDMPIIASQWQLGAMEHFKFTSWIHADLKLYSGNQSFCPTYSMSLSKASPVDLLSTHSKLLLKPQRYIELGLPCSGWDGFGRSLEAMEVKAH